MHVCTAYRSHIDILDDGTNVLPGLQRCEERPPPVFFDVQVAIGLTSIANATNNDNVVSYGGNGYIDSDSEQKRPSNADKTNTSTRHLSFEGKILDHVVES